MRSFKAWGGALLSAAALLSFDAPARADDTVPAWLPGVNLSCAEYNGSSTRIYYDYTYPTKAEIAYYGGKGMKVFRVPLLSGRILSQSVVNANGGPDWQVLMTVIAAAASVNAYVIVDIHQFGAMPAGLVGRNAAATTQFTVAWAEIAKRLKGTPNVIFGLMNEPNQQSATEWLTGVNAALAAIRQAGATQLVLVPGSYWDGAWTWTSTDNGSVMLGVKDPGGNYAFEVHQYLDQYSTGATPAVVPGSGKTNLVAFTNWARQHKVKGFLGEFGFSTSADAMTEGQNLLAYMGANTDVWRGWTYWAGGPWWGNYMFSVEPANGADKPQMALLTKYAAAGPASVPPPAKVATPVATSPVAAAPTAPAVASSSRGGGYVVPTSMLSAVPLPTATTGRAR